MGFADDLKKQLQAQAQKLLHDAAKGAAADLSALGDHVGALFQNDLENVPLEELEAAKTLVEQKLSSALDTYSEIVKAGIDLKAGKLPS